ncbi:MAG: heavy metal translocating P-type ATPase metal-binding domain-containing protein [Bacteroidota bacterium]
MLTTVVCYHCGDDCNETPIVVDAKNFCCNGCKLVFELLNENNLCTYYNLNQHPGVTPEKTYDHKFDYLDIPEVSNQLIQFRNGEQAHVTFYLPGMHCSSCIWLLEHLNRMMPAVIQSQVNFQRKEIRLVFKEGEVGLAAIASQLTAIGYEPHITLSDVDKHKTPAINKDGIIRIAVAGFCFGNIMMLSFPEYFGLENVWQQQSLVWLFRYLNLILSLPVLLYAASGFFISAWKSIKNSYLNIDAPIALAILVTFLRSVYEVINGTGSGYFDSMSGIVFFMLIGRYVQDRTYDTLSFERDYKSYFPLAVRVLQDNIEVSRQVSQLKPGDVIVIRNQELIPTDATLLSLSTHIDYSFVSGESAPVSKHKGDLVYAGGRQLDGVVQLKVTRSISQSYLTRLWNGQKEESSGKSVSQSFVDPINRYFTFFVFAIASVACCYWLVVDPSKALNALSAVLIVACPCGLLLTVSFTNGSIIRLMGRQGCYLKNASAIESMAKADTVVFDKTGTITHGSNIVFKGTATTAELELAVSLAAQSSHVLSKKIVQHYGSVKGLAVTDFKETTSFGIQGTINGKYVMMGSALFITGEDMASLGKSSQVYFSVDGKLKGFFAIDSVYRDGLAAAIGKLQPNFELHLLSGDNPLDQSHLGHFFSRSHMHFNQKPDDKLNYIQQLQSNGKQVMMVGDGLNDAHAFRQSNMAMAVSDDSGHFSPACDAILDGASFEKIPDLLHIAKGGRSIIIACFTFSVIYNIAGLVFAVQGTLQPMIAAILMPASSISIVLISTLSVYILGKRITRTK